MHTRVKICGITRTEDAEAVARAGADAMGLVFYARSPRYVSIEQARAICAVLPPFVSVVALFVDAPREQVQAVLDAVPVDVLQFHGAETADACEGFSRPYIKACGVRTHEDITGVIAAHPAARGYLLDAWQPATHGGGGIAFDWSQVPEVRDRPLILAGGLNADNVVEAIGRVRPYAVDVSSGVEVDKGIKSEDRIQAFMRGVERGDATQSSN